MQIVCILFFSSLSSYISEDFVYSRVDIDECAESVSASETVSSDSVICVSENKKLILGDKAKVLINSVTYESKEEAKKDNLCQKEHSDKYEINIKQKVKRIIFTVDGATKAIIPSSSSSSSSNTACPSEIDVTATDLEKKFIYVESIKCMANTFVTKYIKKFTDPSTPKPYVVSGNKICFLNPMLAKKPVTLTAKVDNKDISVTISAFKSLQDCPKCECPKETSKNSTDTTSAQQTSSTTTIIIVVVVIVVILMGGGAFMFMKK